MCGLKAYDGVAGAERYRKEREEPCDGSRTRIRIPASRMPALPVKSTQGLLSIGTLRRRGNQQVVISSDASILTVLSSFRW